MHVLDRIFEGDDVTALGAVDVVDEGGERRAFARAGRAGDNHETVRLFRLLNDDGRQSELLGGRDVHRKQAERHRGMAALVVNIAAQAHTAPNRCGKVGFARTAQLVQFALSGKGEGRLLQLHLRQNAAV